MNANADHIARRNEKAERNAADFTAAVAAKKADIASLLDHLGDLVTGYGAEDARVNWGVDGSLGYVRERLIEAVQHLSGLERENIEDCLAEIRES